VITLRWYRDKGRGQEAADHVEAKQVMDGWPIAILECCDSDEADRRWHYLLSMFGVNAMTYFTPRSKP
jgi:hypothetical protein